MCNQRSESMSVVVNKQGEIILIIGPMFSGKTTELIRRISRYDRAAMKTIVIKPIKDTRYSNTEVVTHEDLHGDKRRIDAVSVDNLGQCEEIDNFEKVDVVGIDEGNFFGVDIAYYAEKWRRDGKIVIISGLNGSYTKEHFGSFHMLYPLCTDIVMLTAVCEKCKRDAHFTHRKSADSADLVVGGSDKYEALCGSCFDEEIKKKE